MNNYLYVSCGFKQAQVFELGKGALKYVFSVFLVNCFQNFRRKRILEGVEGVVVVHFTNPPCKCVLSNDSFI